LKCFHDLALHSMLSLSNQSRLNLIQNIKFLIISILAQMSKLNEFIIIHEQERLKHIQETKF
jgi:hypothetical protein